MFENRHDEYGNVDVDFGFVESANDSVESLERKHEILHEFGEELLIEFVRRVRDRVSERRNRKVHESFEKFGFFRVRKRSLTHVDHLMCLHARFFGIRSW